MLKRDGHMYSTAAKSNGFWNCLLVKLCLYILWCVAMGFKGIILDIITETTARNAAIK